MWAYEPTSHTDDCYFHYVFIIDALCFSNKPYYYYTHYCYYSYNNERAHVRVQVDVARARARANVHVGMRDVH